MSNWSKQLKSTLLGNTNKVTDVVSGHAMTYDELFKQAIVFGSSLKLKQQSIVTVLLPNSLEFIISYIGCAMHGLIFAPVPYFLNAIEVKKILEYHQSNILITDRTDIKYHTEILSPPKILTTELELITLPVEVNDSDILSLYYSSGTTGNPKGVMYSHENKFALIKSIVEDFSFNDQSKHFAFLPFGHTASLNYSVFPSLFLGSEMFIASGFDKIRSRFFQLLSKHKITYVEIVPTVAQTLVKLNEDVTITDLSELPFIGCGSAPLSKNIQIEFMRKFGLPLANLYGLSETGPSHIDDPRSPNWEPGSIGKALSVNDCKIAEDGEILLRGKNVMVGYFKNKNLTEEIIKDGWFYTGDYGYEKDGLFYFLDRKKDLIILAGMNIYPAEIEDILYKDKRVLECAVFGIEDKTVGEQIIAYVKSDLIHTEDIIMLQGDLINLCKDNLSRFKVPSTIVITDDIPKTASGKIIRRELKRIFLQKYSILED